MMAESAEGEVRYLLSDGLGSIRQAVDGNAEVVSSDEYDPYGNPLTFHASRFTPYGYTGEWWEQDVGLLHLRARWYLAEDGIFVSRDLWPGNTLQSQTQNGWAYVQGNPILYIDPSGYAGCTGIEVGDMTAVQVYQACLQGSARGRNNPGAGPVIATGGIAIGVLIGAAVDTVLDEMADIANEAWDNWQEPEPNREPEPKVTPTPPGITFYKSTPTCTPERGPKILTVGEGNFGYSMSLHNLHPDWKITGTSYGDGSNSQILYRSQGNLKLYINVDATDLRSGEVGRDKYDAIIFNNPYAGGDGSETASLISKFKQSARGVLASNGKMHINVTKRLLEVHGDVALELGLPDNKRSTIENYLPTFGQTEYYAPFIPHYSTGGAMDHYRADPTRVAKLKNFIFR